MQKGVNLLEEVERVQKLQRKRSKFVGMKLNPELVKLIDKAIEKESDVESRSALFEKLALHYLFEKGMI